MRIYVDKVRTQENFKSHEILGSHQHVEDGVTGFRFIVWAPNAKELTVIGDFNSWEKHANPLTLDESTGVWYGFVPDAMAGQAYKYWILGADGVSRYKADPYARATEKRPHNASILTLNEEFTWTDTNWGKQEIDFATVPINIYEAHIPSWKKHEDGSFYSYREFAEAIGDYLVDMGYTHLELLPLAAYHDDSTYGYQTTSYFAPTPRHGSAEDFKYMINHLHSLGIKVIMDWTPSYFPRNDFALETFDGTNLYEYADSGNLERWRSLPFDYRNEKVKAFLLSNAYYWIAEYHLDGIRVNDIDGMLYRNLANHQYANNSYDGQINEPALVFLQELSEMVHAQFQGIAVIGEDKSKFQKTTETVENGGLGFDLKWDGGWTLDTLEYFSKDYVDRSNSHNRITFSMMYNFNERYILSLSHEDMSKGNGSLISKMPGDYWRQFASLRLLYMYMISHPGAKLMFMGGDLAQFVEWNYEDSVQWFLLDYDMHNRYHNSVKEINHIYKDTPAFWQLDRSWEGFKWLITDDSKNAAYTWFRRDEEDNIVINIFNMTPEPIRNYKVPVPVRGVYELIYNSDDSRWGGSDYDVLGETKYTRLHKKNETFGEALYGWKPEEYYKGGSDDPRRSGVGGLFYSRDISAKNYEQSIKINLPPLGGMILKLVAKDPSKQAETPWPDPELPYPEGFNPYNKAADEGFKLE